ncbi:MAG: ribonuclease E/G [Defluviitaleaceae bacterium]|nr:ribonuclease E/G [Defluviitaleaceae bacterium]
MKRIIIDFSQQLVRTALAEDKELIETIIDDPDEPHIAGNIYAGIVTRVLPNGFAFINIGMDENVFIDLSARKGTKVKHGAKLLVQIARARHGGKAALATTELCFAGRYAVVFDSPGAMIGVSKKIKSGSDRKRLKKLARELLPKGYGVIVRTGAATERESDFIDEINSLVLLSKKVAGHGKNAKAPSVVYEKAHPLHGTLQALMDGTVSEIVINNPDERGAIAKVVKALGFDDIVKLSDEPDLFAFYGIADAFKRALDKRVWLKSGGYIIIEKTEACLVIDVNTGKAVRAASRFVTNCEAAVEIARQLRLRNLSGIIIIDFIGGSKTDERRKLHQLLEQETAKDRVRVNVVGMTKLGLMQLTRQRTGKELSAES